MGLKHGKGIIYTKKGSAKYKGDFVIGKPKGKGKYIDESEIYYKGEWWNDKKYGKEIDYYKSGLIKYEGYFLIVSVMEMENIFMKMVNII